MKKIVFLAATLFMFFAISANAQQRGPREHMTPEQQATRMVERLTEELKLDENQQKELQTYFTEQFQKRQEEFEKNRPAPENREAMREKMEKEREATDAKLKERTGSDRCQTQRGANRRAVQDVQSQRRKAHERNATTQRRTSSKALNTFTPPISCHALPGWSMDASTFLRTSSTPRSVPTGRASRKHRRKSGGTIDQPQRE